LENLKDNAYQKVYDFAFDYANRRYRPFTSEDIKTAFEAKFSEIEFFDYGSVMRSLKLKNIILENGHVKGILPKSKGRLITLWISKNYSDQQSRNRISENKNLPTLFDEII